MNIPAALETYMSGLRSHDIEMIAASFAPDIQFVTPARTMGNDETLAFLTALYRGFPDWRYDNDPPFAAGDGTFGVTWRQGGTHSGRLEFPDTDFPGVDPTGRAVVIPEQQFYYRVDAAGMHEIRPDPVPGGAPRGIFEQIGVELPPL